MKVSVTIVAEPATLAKVLELLAGVEGQPAKAAAPHPPPVAATAPPARPALPRAVATPAPPPAFTPTPAPKPPHKSVPERAREYLMDRGECTLTDIALGIGTTTGSLAKYTCKNGPLADLKRRHNGHTVLFSLNGKEQVTA